jgi:hypothetical protein
MNQRPLLFGLKKLGGVHLGIFLMGSIEIFPEALSRDFIRILKLKFENTI